MKILFAGTPDFAARHLNVLSEAGHTVVAVLTQPDRPSGRGQSEGPSPVKSLALAKAIPILQPTHLKNPEISVLLAGLEAEIMVVVAYGLLIPPPILELFPHGALNVHASLLPRWRGAAPIQRAIEAGDQKSGICIMQMESGLDTGPVWMEVECEVNPAETAGALQEQLSVLGQTSLLQVLSQIEAGIALQPRPQSTTGITYAHKIRKEEAELDWSQPAALLEQKIRAFNPYPGCWTRFNGTLIKVWQSRGLKGALSAPSLPEPTPGRVMACDSNAITVACGQGALELLTLQRAGGKPMAAGQFTKGYALRAGNLLGNS